MSKKVATHIELIDRMTAPILSINNAINDMTARLDAVENAANIDPSVMSGLRSQIDAAAAAAQGLNDSYKTVDDAIRASANEQENLNRNIQKGNGLFGQFKGLLAGVGVAFGARAGIGFVRESINMTNQQIRAEQQLANVLANQGATQADFVKLRERAAKISNTTMYGDEALIAGAGELATYIKDADALQSMMKTLANYAAGMSGGGEVGMQEMTNYATQLGKALDGTYDGLRKKGFQLTDAQKQIIETGTDMQKAMVIDEVISQSWAGLAEQMAQTPEGMRVSMMSAVADVREEFGAALYPTIIRVIEGIKANIPTIRAAIMSVVPAIQTVISVIGKIGATALKVARFFAKNWSIIAPIAYGIATAIIAIGVASKATAIYLAAQNVVMGAAAAVKALLSGASLAAAAAQMGLNAAVWAFPGTWILAAIIAIIAVFYAAIAVVNRFAGTTLSATGIIIGAFAVLGAAILNTVVGALNGAIQFLWTLFVNPIMSVVEFIQNIFNGGFNGISGMFANLLGQMVSAFVSFGKVFTKIADAVFGTSLTASLNRVQQTALSWGKNNKAVTIKRDAPEIGGRVAYGDAWNAGNEAGRRVEGVFKRGEATATAAPSDFVHGNFHGIDRNYVDRDIADIAGNTRRTADFSEENLKYLRDVAEREAINNFTTAEVHFDMGGVTNNVSSGMDLNSLMDYIEEGVSERLMVVAEGVYV